MPLGYGRITTDTQRVIADAADRFGSGMVTLTTRQTFEIQGVKYENIDALPAKFKIGVGGCPNNCIKPELNDIGVRGNRIVVDGKAVNCYVIYIGGHWGRETGKGRLLDTTFATEEEVLDMIAKIIDYYRENGQNALIG